MNNGNAVIYMLFIDQGYNGWSDVGDLVKIDTGIGGVSNPNGISDVRAVDLDGNGTVDRLYAGDLLGNLHVVDVSSSQSEMPGTILGTNLSYTKQSIHKPMKSSQ